jgi:D-tyrosyl-tRNA(Tyr) deacylase
MRGLVQRVSEASVSVAGEVGREVVGEIGAGLCVLVGVTHDDTEASARKLADKIWGLRVIDDDNGVMNRSVADIGGEVLIVSQFTLYGDTSGGRRPSWINAARPEHAEPLVQAVIDQLRASGANVASGRFRTEMQVSLVNDGPVTVLLEV